MDLSHNETRPDESEQVGLLLLCLVKNNPRIVTLGLAGVDLGDPLGPWLARVTEWHRHRGTAEAAVRRWRPLYRALLRQCHGLLNHACLARFLGRCDAHGSPDTQQQQLRDIARVLYEDLSRGWADHHTRYTLRA